MTDSDNKPIKLRLKTSSECHTVAALNSLEHDVLISLIIMIVIFVYFVYSSLNLELLIFLIIFKRKFFDVIVLIFVFVWL